ncbi:hypothetical protein GUJ93_ZPchr0005g15165 [Zizania palustris]|uniref:Uncharacterized protein n=1 Tax=Zizania palustris TaxID=103762 RepID=A0A8J5W0X2_ZIZPA|nr:hypothetical protein GUJ93_ZPchr0005g15165 [Zizania palustris]
MAARCTVVYGSIAMDAKTAACGGEEAVAPPNAAPSSSQRAPAPVGGQQGSAAPPMPAGGAGAGAGEDEQRQDGEMERFYALLANVRAMRGVYRSSGDGAGADSAGEDGATGGNADGGGERRRARRANLPWRPVFRMEDFADAPAGKGGGATSRSVVRALPAKQPANEADNDDGRGT